MPLTGTRPSELELEQSAMISAEILHGSGAPAHKTWQFNIAAADVVIQSAGMPLDEYPW